MIRGAAQVFTPSGVFVRNMVTLKDISLRLKSVKNIQKITTSMKMVSAAKYARAERDLKAARPYGEGAKAFFDKSGIEADQSKPKHLVVVLSSDRGLCGAIHSSLSKAAKAIIAEAPEGVETKLIVVGEKPKAILQRTHASSILAHFNELGRKPVTFADATKISSAIVDSGYDFERGTLLFNRFKSVISYSTQHQPIFTLANLTESEKIYLYDSLDDEILRNYNEYALANLIFYCLKEGACSEQSSRMTAMDSASKNAGEMIDKLTLTYNRTRQAVITRELVEIISGAAAL